MPARDVRILVVGRVAPHLQSLLERLACRGWRSYGVETYAEAQTVFRTLQFDVVLAMEELADGRGFQLSHDVARRSVNLYVQVDLSDGHLWLPAVERGQRTLGERALDPAEFEAQLVTVLSGDEAMRSPGDAQRTQGLEAPRSFVLAQSPDPARSPVAEQTGERSFDARTAAPASRDDSERSRTCALSFRHTGQDAAVPAWASHARLNPARGDPSGAPTTIRASGRKKS